MHYFNLDFLQLVAVLREVHYLKILDKQGIPVDALNLFNHRETLQTCVGNLNLCVEW